MTHRAERYRKAWMLPAAETLFLIDRAPERRKRAIGTVRGFAGKGAQRKKAAPGESGPQ